MLSHDIRSKLHPDNGTGYLVHVFFLSLIWPTQYAEWIQFEGQILRPEKDNHSSDKVEGTQNFLKNYSHAGNF